MKLFMAFLLGGLVALAAVLLYQDYGMKPVVSVARVALPQDVSLKRGGAVAMVIQGKAKPISVQVKFVGIETNGVAQ